MSNKLDYVSPGSPTYWPADPRKVLDLIEFTVTLEFPTELIIGPLPLLNMVVEFFKNIGRMIFGF